MELPLAVKSNYYKGLLVLSKGDREINDREKNLLICIGTILDFDRRFCEATIDDLLSNAHIPSSPIVFSDETLTECFFRDALCLAYVDGQIHPKELRWLRLTAQANGKSSQWLHKLMKVVCKKEDIEKVCSSLEIRKYL